MASPLRSTKKEHVHNEQIGAFVRTVFALIGAIALGYGVLWDIQFSSKFLENIVGPTVALILAIGIGSAFEIVGSAYIFDEVRFKDLTKFEQKLVYVILFFGYAFDILTNWGEMSKEFSSRMPSYSTLEGIIAVMLIIVVGVILAFLEYLVSMCVGMVLANIGLWFPDFLRGIGGALASVQLKIHESLADDSSGGPAQQRRSPSMHMRGSARSEEDMDSH